MRLPKNHQILIDLYLKDHLTLKEIANIYNVTPVAVHRKIKEAKALLGLGFSSKDAEWVDLCCGYCNAPLKRPRSKWRRYKNHYCNQDCYTASQQHEGSYLWRNGQRIARIIVRRVFGLQEGMVVHHIDGDDRNNNISNLVVFNDQADHIRFHRGEQVGPIWQGEDNKIKE